MVPVVRFDSLRTGRLVMRRWQDGDREPLKGCQLSIVPTKVPAFPKQIPPKQSSNCSARSQLSIHVSRQVTKLRRGIGFGHFEGGPGEFVPRTAQSWRREKNRWRQFSDSF